MTALLVILGLFAAMFLAGVLIGVCFAGAHVRRQPSRPRSRAARLAVKPERVA